MDLFHLILNTYYIYIVLQDNLFAKSPGFVKILFYFPRLFVDFESQYLSKSRGDKNGPRLLPGKVYK